MSTNEIVKQLRACEKVAPVSRYSTKHIHLADNPMIVAFVRMAGESRPWGIAYGQLKDKSPKVLTAGDGRNREEVARIAEEFAATLLTYCRAEGYTFDPITKENYQLSAIPQIWVPDDRHVEMFHHLEYAYWRTRKDDDRNTPLTALARLSGWIFREYNKKGQQFIIDSAKALRDSYVFPTDTSSLGSLTTAIAWFGKGRDLQKKRVVAREAANQRVSTTLDPNLDKKVLVPLVDQRADLLRAGKSITSVNKKIHDELSPELVARWSAVKDAYVILANDTRDENAGVRSLIENSLDRYVSQFQRLELRIQDPTEGPAFTPHPETDFHGSAAAAAYYKMSQAESAYIATLIHYDKELQAESLASGHSFLGKVKRIDNLGVGRSTRAIWTLEVEMTDLLRLREGESYAILGNPKSSFTVREVTLLKENLLQIEGEWFSPRAGQLLAAANTKPLDSSWINDRVMFVPINSSHFENMRSKAVWDAAHGIGAWLTHGRAPAPVVDNLIDDITQLQN